MRAPRRSSPPRRPSGRRRPLRGLGCPSRSRRARCRRRSGRRAPRWPPSALPATIESDRALGAALRGAAEPRLQQPRRLVEAARSASVTCRNPEPVAAFSSRLVPSAILRPWSITAIRSASWSASSRYCVVSRIVTPDSASRGSCATRSGAPSGQARSSARRGTARRASRSAKRRCRAGAACRRNRTSPACAAASARSKAARRSSARASRRRPRKPQSRARSSRFSRPVRSSSSDAN